MTFASQRYLEKFENLSGTISVVFPLYRYEYQPQQDMEAWTEQVIGLEMGYDALGSRLTRLGAAMDTVRFVLLADTAGAFDTSFDTLKSDCYRIGKGKLWTLGADGTRRWAWARLTQFPEITVGQRNSSWAPMILGFSRFSKWYASAAIQSIQAVTATGFEWSVNNTGQIAVDLMTLRLRANTAAGITNPKITNRINGYVFESTRDSASVNDELRLDTERSAIERSVDDGVNYSDDFASYVWPALQQLGTFRLEPGLNTIRYDGAGVVNLNVQFDFYPVFL